MRYLSLLYCVLLLSACAGQGAGLAMEPKTDTFPDRPIGVAVDADALLQDARYRKIISDNFQSITPENAMKLSVLAPEREKFSPQQSDEIVSFAISHNKRLRGHPLVWHRQNPDWLSELSEAELRAFLALHIKRMVERYRDEIKVWDVVNEAVLQAAVFRPSIWLKKLGPQYLEQAFRDAARYSRDAKLFYNDFDLAFNRKKLLATLWLLDSLREAGVRVDAIGFQMHLRPAAMPTAEQIRAAFALVKQRGYQLEVTELDVSLPLPVSDELLAQQAQVVCQVVLACLENGSCTGITFWGLTDAHSWIPHVLPGLGAATLFDPDYQQKPAWYGLEAALTTKSCRQVNSSSFF